MSYVRHSAMRILLSALLALTVAPSVLRAQTCLGQTSFAGGAIRVGAGGEFGNGASILRGGVGLGKARGVFGGATLGFISGDGGKGFLVSGLLGTELMHPILARLELCPTASLGLQFGPSGYYERNYILGMMTGYPLISSSKHTRLILTGGFQAGYQQYGFHDIQFISPGYNPAVQYADGSHEWYGLVDAGLGVTFGDRVSVVPMVRLPVGYTDRSPSFLIRAGVNLGRRR